ncbi:transmembrane protein 200A [Fundulus heteroclitus]|uniref:Transmembrane protein 200A n=1 Tax=Fundulus heteroclitus TaxID=8078 RepID=A0A3Q2R286_FUNHE|nr:transmembrane protein 200A [Fundulus heteroclitus]XP_012734524.1 transmembrane protein 200A [Fundulus heteroclitus]
MTAAAGVLTGLAKLKRQDSARSQHRPIPLTSQGLANPTSEAAPRKRKRRTDVVVVRGKLRLYSASGFFLFLGLIILAIGIGMATLGYWPHNKAAPTGGGNQAKVEKGVTNASHEVQDSPSKQTGGALTRFLEQHLHSERMKMLGPFTMGIGIFIFICANAILHENRDRETKIIHMRDMYSTVIDIHRLRQKEQRQYHHRSSLCARELGDLRAFGADTAPRLAGNSLLAFSSRAASRVGSTEEEEEVLLGEEEFHRHRGQARLDCSFAGLLAPLYKDRPFYGAGLGLAHSDSMGHQWSVDGDGEKGRHHAGSIVSSSISAFTLPVIKLNNCVIDEPEMEAITEEERGDERRKGERPGPLNSKETLVVPVASVAKASKPPGLQRSNSASSSSRCSSFSSCSLSPAPSSTSGCWLSPGAARSDFGSNSSLHMLNSHSHSKSLDLERRPSMLSVRPEQRKHPSWPRLDRSNSSRSHVGKAGSTKGYTRLEDREEQGEWRSDTSASPTERRDYSKREKLLMISRSHNTLSFEQDAFNSSTLKRGSSETRF